MTHTDAHNFGNGIASIDRIIPVKIVEFGRVRKNIFRNKLQS